MKLTVIGPNLPPKAGATFHVHAAGCADITRSPLYRFADSPWTADFASVEAVVKGVYPPNDFEYDEKDWESWTAGEFKFLPCVKGLPKTVEG